MSRRRVLCALLLASAVLVCFAGWLWMANGNKMTRARFEQVKEGMSREDVIRTVGGPPGDYTIDGAVPDQGYANIDYWRFDDGLLVVWFDKSGKVVQVDVEIIPRPETITERIRRWLGL
jgi:hypothetical protein